MRETWRPVLGQAGKYEVSDLGRVRSLSRWVDMKSRKGKAYRSFRKGRVLRPGRMSGSGHLSVTLGRDTGSVCVHQLVLEAFVCPRPPRLEARHLNGNAADNRLVNLAWGTRTRNTQDCKWHGPTKRHILTPSDVIAIRKKYALGSIYPAATSALALAAAYGVARGTIHAAVRYVNHKDVTA